MPALEAQTAAVVTTRSWNQETEELRTGLHDAAGLEPRGHEARTFLKEFAMLVLSRKVGEVLKIGDNIEVMVVKASKNEVRLGITAPKELKVVRDDAKKRERKAGG